MQQDVWHDVSRPAWNESLSARIDHSLPFLSESERSLYLVPYFAMISCVFMTHDPWRAAISQHAAQRPPPCKKTCVRLSSAANNPAHSRLEMLSALSG